MSRVIYKGVDKVCISFYCVLVHSKNVTGLLETLQAQKTNWKIQFGFEGLAINYKHKLLFSIMLSQIWASQSAAEL